MCAGLQRVFFWIFRNFSEQIFKNRMLPRYLGGLLLNFTCYCNPTNIYLFKVSNKNTRKRCKICSTLKIKAPERRHRWRCGVFIVNYEHISLVKFDFIVDFEQVNVSREVNWIYEIWSPSWSQYSPHWRVSLTLFYPASGRMEAIFHKFLKTYKHGQNVWEKL